MPITIDEIIEKNLKKGRPKIGFGLAREDKEILNSLKKSKKWAEIFLVGPKKIKRIKGFKKIISADPERKLAEILVEGKVEGIVRGTLDDFKTYEAYQKMVGKDKTKEMVNLILLADVKGRQFYLSEASNPAGWTREEKIKSCEKIIRFMSEELKMKPKIGCITGVRHETFKRRKNIKKWPISYLNQTYKDAQAIVRHFNKKGITAKNYAIELSTAVEDGCNIIVPPNGMVGNQIFRAVSLIGGGRIVICPRINLPHVYEDNSRNEKDFSYHLKWVAAWANSRKK
jgi:predicted methyltransferase MtxX (methanogen marker protein 4)